MAYDILLQPGAEDDIDDAYYWYEHRRRGLGDDFLDELIEYYEKIKHNPAIFKWAERNIAKLVCAGFHMSFYIRSFIPK